MGDSKAPGRQSQSGSNSQPPLAPASQIPTLDAYDVLGVPLDANEEMIKKAYKKLSLQLHPDKARESDRKDATERFQSLKNAYDILSNEDRKKIYDVFSVDLGPNKPDMMVWELAVEHLLSPVTRFTVEAIVARIAQWILSFWVFSLLLILILAALVVYKWSALATPWRVYSAIIGGALLVNAVFPFSGDVVCLGYLLREVAGVQLITSWKGGLISLGGVSVLAFFAQNWWWWILVLLVVLCFILLIAAAVSCGLVRTWIDVLSPDKAKEVKEKRVALRAWRSSLIAKRA